MPRSVSEIASGVSPPCAGVHRRISPALTWPARVSPVRGGSPVDAVVHELNELCLPRSRGFTAINHAETSVTQVSPPCAGVHRQ